MPVRGEPWLLAQPVGETEPFGGGVRRLLWAEGRYREGPALRLPAGTTVYGLAFLQLASGPEPEAVALTPEDRLGVWTAGGRALWVSGDPYGGAAVTFPYTPAREQKDQDAIVGRVSGRIVALPSGGEGPEVLVFENLVPVGGQFRTFLPRLAPLAFTQGRIHRLRWQDGGFRRVWASRPTEGYIADFAYGDLDGDGVPEVVVGVVARGLEALNPLGRPKAQLVFFELP